MYLITLTFRDDLTGRENTRRTVRNTEEAARANARNLQTYYGNLRHVSNVRATIQQIETTGEAVEV